MLRPTESWVAKWQFMKSTLTKILAYSNIEGNTQRLTRHFALENYVPGLYAIEVPDRLTAKEALEFVNR